MLVKSLLVQGAGSALSGQLGSLSPSSCEALVLMSLGADHSTLLNVVQDNNVDCPVYMTETYGILGFDEQLQKNVELMEKGRGSEYGFGGGSGGQGCLAVGYSGGIQSGSTDEFPPNAASLMVIADQSGSWASVKQKAPVHYGGITKQAFVLSKNKKEFQQVPYFWIADTSKEPTGIAAFDGDTTEATNALLKTLPTGWNTSGSVGLFPCFTRGVNLYGAENVESDAIGKVLPNSRIYGMFAHGELGPSDYTGFTAKPNSLPCTQHSGTSILSIHTKPLN